MLCHINYLGSYGRKPYNYLIRINAQKIFFLSYILQKAHVIIKIKPYICHCPLTNRYISI